MAYNNFRPAVYNNGPIPYAQTLYAPPPQTSYMSQIPQTTNELRDIPQSKSIISSSKTSVPLTASSEAPLTKALCVNSRVDPKTISNAKNLNSKVEYSVQTRAGGKAVMLHNVESPELLELSSKTLSFEKQEVNKDGDLPFTFKPDNNTHVVQIVNGDKTIATFGLKPKKVANRNVTFSIESSPDKGEKYLLAKNVDNPDKITVRSSTMDFSQGEFDNENNLKFYFVPDGNTHLLSVYDGGKNIGKLGIKPNNVEVKLSKPVGDKHRLEVNNLYRPNDLQVLSDRDLQWKLVPAMNHGSYFIEFTAPKNSQVIQVFTIGEDGKRIMAKGGNVALAPIEALRPVPSSMPLSSIKSNQIETSNRANEPMKYTSQTPMSLYGEQGPPPTDEKANVVKAGNLVMTGKSRAL